MERLDFEQPIVELEEQLKKAIQLGEDNDADVTKIVSDIEKKLSKLRKETYGNLTAWQRVQISRHPNRPYTLDYIEMLTKGEFIELHGDRTVKDDKAMIGGFGNMDGQSVMFIGQQKGKNTKLRQFRNFGMANPEGYRKALRLMKMAEKFNNLTEKNRPFLFLCLCANFCKPGVHFYQLYCFSKYLQSNFEVHGPCACGIHLG